MSGPPVVVVGASAGGVEALTQLVAGLPPDLPAAVLVVLHVPSRGTSRLDRILSRAGSRTAAPARSGERLEPGQLLVAPSDEHLLVHDGAVLVSSGAKENGHRPAVDPLFRSAARWSAPGVVAVVLSGALDDGAAGAASVAARGGAVLVQDPTQALLDSMPRAALRAVPAAVAVSAGAVGERLPGLLAERAGRPAPAPDPDLTWETDMAEMDEGAVQGIQSPGRRVPVSCPSCHGAMNEVRVGAGVSFRCHVGHAYGPLSLLQAQAEVSEAALWTALASMEEQAAVHRGLAETTDAPDGPGEHLRQAEEITARARALRRQLRLSARG